jgi:NAD(P)-dependent dehydrogenase (short-subunit alcohol dehydrogenase family)
VSTPVDLRLDGKVAVVTGGSRGIGLAIGRAFAEAGAHVLLTSRKQDGLDAAAAAIRAATGAEVEVFAANAGDPEQAEACIAHTVGRFGGLDILVNNAATNVHFGPVLDIDLPAAEKTVQLNQLGYLAWCKHAVAAGLRDGGSILNVASIGGFGVEVGIGWYNVTKAAVIHLTKQLAYELGPAIRVNAIAPGLVKTDLSRGLWEGNEERIATRLPLGRLGTPDDIAGAAVFLVSDAASWITGHTLVADGGLLVKPSF